MNRPTRKRVDQMLDFAEGFGDDDMLAEFAAEVRAQRAQIAMLEMDWQEASDERLRLAEKVERLQSCVRFLSALVDCCEEKAEILRS